MRQIVESAPYRRTVRVSIFGRLFRWFIDGISRLFSEARGIPFGRTIAVVVIAVIVLLVVARLVYASRLGTDELQAARRRARGRAIDPLEEAEALAARGEYTEAAHALYRGLLERLARRDGIRLHPSKTSGDYARELRRIGSPAHGPFARFRQLYDRVLFGYASCDAAAWARLREHADAVLALERAA